MGMLTICEVSRRDDRMAFSSILRSLVDRVTTGRGPGYVFSASGITRDLQKIQAGELYIHGANEVTATGFFKYQYPTNEIPRVQVTPVADPSGTFYVSASGESKFVVTFSTTPLGDDKGGTPATQLVPMRIATWQTII